MDSRAQAEMHTAEGSETDERLSSGAAAEEPSSEVTEAWVGGCINK